jgi:hypothetical protein
VPLQGDTVAVLELLQTGGDEVAPRSDVVGPDLDVEHGVEGGGNRKVMGLIVQGWGGKEKRPFSGENGRFRVS